MEPLLLEPDEGEIITHRPEKLVRIKASTEQFALTESRYGPGERGPDLHVHREHADCFWVLGGELTFTFGSDSQTVRAGEGTWLMMPPGVVHTFLNESDADALFLNVHAPNAGFAEYMRATRDATTDDEREAALALFDTEDSEPGDGLPASDAVIRRPGEGETIELGRTRLTIKAGGDDAGGPLSLNESVLEADYPGPPAHRHREHTDIFYVLDGVLGLLLENGTFTLPQDAFAMVPPGTAHTFFNPHGHPARIFNLMTPGGFEQYFRDVAAELPADGPPDQARMAEIASRYDFELVG